jgi:hypothetical protein
MEKDRGMKRFPWTSSVASQELRNQNHRGLNTAEVVVAGALFTAGLTLGTLAALWLTRSRRTG